MERDPERLEAFSDGVLAVIITIMAFQIQRPKGATFEDLRGMVPSLLAYLLSFIFIGIYWNNHHQLLRATQRISGSVMWANLHLLFWLSLIPVLTDWLRTSYKAHLPASIYGLDGLLAGLAYTILTRRIIAANGTDSKVAQAVGSDTKGLASLALYALGVALAWISPWISFGIYVAVSIMWFIPDRRLARSDQGLQEEGA
jgi:uncharacterized membrane protein